MLNLFKSYTLLSLFWVLSTLLIRPKHIPAFGPVYDNLIVSILLIIISFLLLLAILKSDRKTFLVWAILTISVLLSMELFSLFSDYPIRFSYVFVPEIGSKTFFELRGEFIKVSVGYYLLNLSFMVVLITTALQKLIKFNNKQV